ncbi:MAG: geranylgeranyl reductase family protein [Anaerolineales bacterium]|nr:geranylgeranyl reductase family protein [Anaerolineales bacterium]
MIYDVIVVGAGPAGSVLAYRLARYGLRVLIIEKAQLPRYKTCGGGLTFKALDNLPFDIDPVIEMRAAGGIVAYKGQMLLKIDTARPIACLVMRDRFDYFLAQQAVGAGAALYDGLPASGFDLQDGRATVITPNGQYHARILVGADGVHSAVARAASLLGERQVGVGLEAELAAPSAALAQLGPYAAFDFGALPYGYGWIFPKRQHLSVGIMHARPGKVARLREHLQSFIASFELLQEHELLSLRGHLIPLGGRPAALQRGRTLLVGDAANLADPWLGEGLYYAIRSARLAAEAIAHALEEGPLDLSAYTRQVFSEIVGDFRYARIFAWLVYHLPRLGTTLMQKSERLQDGIFGVMRGDCSFEQFVWGLARGLPRILAQALKPGAETPAYRYQA